MTRRFMMAAVASAVAAGCGAAQDKKKGKMFRGQVKAVSEKDKTLTVDNERVEGWMEPMTMAYEVDDPKILKQVKPGDKITATVYDGDYRLHDVKVAQAGGEKKK